MERYHALVVSSTDEAVLGILSAFDFESFEEREDEIVAYMADSNVVDGVLMEVEDALSSGPYQHHWELIEPQNWNELWEASFHPVKVDTFCLVRAQFHAPDEDVMYDLVIQPKMAFGTGHHATTHMVIQWMSGLDMKHKSVFDFGCGTGILAILAAKMGASFVDAVDIEEESFLNTQENAIINKVGNIHAFCGDLQVVPEKKYDVILANINRNILIKYAKELHDRMNPGGVLIWSGVLEDDLTTVSDSFSSLGYQEEGKLTRNGWGAVKMHL